MLASRGFGLNWGLSCAAADMGQLAWWSNPGRTLLEAGNLDLAIGALAGLVSIAWLVRFDQAPDLISWLVLLFAGCLGWFAHPLFSMFLLPLSLIYYLSVGARHRLGWALGVLGEVVGGVAGDWFWLFGWVLAWW